MLFSIVAVSIYIPTNSARTSHFSKSSPAFIVCRFFYDGHISFALGDIAKKVLLQFMSENVLLICLLVPV